MPLMVAFFFAAGQSVAVSECMSFSTALHTYALLKIPITRLSQHNFHEQEVTTHISSMLVIPVLLWISGFSMESVAGPAGATIQGCLQEDLPRRLQQISQLKEQSKPFPFGSCSLRVGLCRDLRQA